MKYTFNYELIRQGEEQPIKGQVIELGEDEKTGQHVLPNVGDYVQVQAHFGDTDPMTGRVKTRLFKYSNAIYPGKNTCHVNIVLEEPEAGVWERLSSSE